MKKNVNLIDKISIIKYKQKYIKKYLHEFIEIEIDKINLVSNKNNYILKLYF